MKAMSVLRKLQFVSYFLSKIVVLISLTIIRLFTKFIVNIIDVLLTYHHIDIAKLPKI